jgi:hypothetical protein
MDHGSCRKRGRFLPRVWHIVLAIVAVVAGLVLLSTTMSRRALNRRLEAVRAAGYPTTLAELAEYTALPEGVANAADVYQRAFRAYVPPASEANVPILGEAELPARGVALPEPMARALADCLAANQQCLVLLNEAGRIEHCRYEWDYADVLSPLKRPDHQKGLPNCAKLLRLCAVYHGHMDDADAAAASVRSALQLADSLRREPGWLAHTSQGACLAGAVSGLERALSLTTFTDRQLRELDEALVASAAAFDFVETMITQRCFAIEELRGLKYSKRPPLKVLIRTRETVLWVPGIHGKGLPDVLDYAEDCVDAARLPPARRLRRFHQLETQLYRLSTLHAMVKAWGPALMTLRGRTIETDLRVRAHLDLARAALAIERYRLATGKVPAELAVLVPHYLNEVPIDPFDGQPIRYRRTEAGYLLYSIMEDGQDNGGRTREEAGQDEPYDLCLIVVR